MPCPRCGQPSPFTSANKWRPFCSERCKMIDLGDWANERYRVPEEDQEEDKKPADEGGPDEPR